MVVRRKMFNSPHSQSSLSSQQFSSQTHHRYKKKPIPNNNFNNPRDNHVILPKVKGLTPRLKVLSKPSLGYDNLPSSIASKVIIPANNTCSYPNAISQIVPNFRNLPTSSLMIVCLSKIAHKLRL